MKNGQAESMMGPDSGKHVRCIHVFIYGPMKRNGTRQRRLEGKQLRRYEEDVEEFFLSAALPGIRDVMEQEAPDGWGWDIYW